jgi:predicted nucleotidyltransferase component of viral defense system
MFSAEYLQQLSAQTGFPADGLQKQMSLILVLREIRRHPLLRPAFVLRGGTAINLFLLDLPRLSVDIDLNYVGDASMERMREDRLKLEAALKQLLEALGMSVQYAPASHAGGKWRLRTASGFGGNITLEVDLNYIMRTPIFGTQGRTIHSPDMDYATDFPTVSTEELFAGKIKALMERRAPRDLFDVCALADGSVPCDMSRLRSATALLGLTCERDWRTMKPTDIDRIEDREVQAELLPLLRSGETVDLPRSKARVKAYLGDILSYSGQEGKFFESFYEEGVYQPGLLFPDPTQAALMEKHPAVLWKLQNHRKYLGLESEG